MIPNSLKSEIRSYLAVSTKQLLYVFRDIIAANKCNTYNCIRQMEETTLEVRICGEDNTEADLK
jgi:hypothetical protein